ncbi:DUF551 domain-containing protein [Escherichia coli]|nr:DUF551 domain-containing protein [Escherichia coli]
MSTFTDKELIKEIKERIGSLDVRDDIERRAYEIALASLEAEPIAWECGENIILLNPDTVEAYAKRAEITPKPLFAAPPVPAVPEEKPMPNPLSMLEREITQLIGDAQEATVTGYELIAEAWRLMDGQDPKTSDWHSKASKYLNSNIVEKVDDDRIEAVKAVLRRLAGNYPVIPDSWISCSERMPDKLIPVIVMYEDGDMWSAMWNGNRWDDGTEYPDPHSVTHWREMPAAPQQEVNRG